jgi:hypothetical protein
MLLADFHPESRVWVYQADRFLSETEVHWLDEQIEAFTKEWASHGSQLKASGTVVDSIFVVLSVNADESAASGCSIDSSVRFIKQAGAELNVDFFNRLKVVKENKLGEKEIVSYASLKNFSGEYFYDLTVQTLQDFRTSFRKEV